MTDRATVDLQVEGLDLDAAAGPLLRDLRLHARPGQRWALLGRNGAGKSTLLRRCAGLGPGRHGTVAVGGRDVDAAAPADLAALRALMPAQPADRFGIGVLEAVVLAQTAPDPGAALELLGRVDAGALARRSVLALSAGERQRVSLAQTLAQGAPLLLLDEPVSFQDPAHQGLLGRLLRELDDRTVVFAAHDLNWVARVATHVLAMFPGGQWVAGEAAEVLRAEVLERVYACAWQRLEGPGGAFWVPD